MKRSKPSSRRSSASTSKATSGRARSAPDRQVAGVILQPKTIGAHTALHSAEAIVGAARHFIAVYNENAHHIIDWANQVVYPTGTNEERLEDAVVLAKSVKMFFGETVEAPPLFMSYRDTIARWRVCGGAPMSLSKMLRVHLWITLEQLQRVLSLQPGEVVVDGEYRFERIS